MCEVFWYDWREGRGEGGGLRRMYMGYASALLSTKGLPRLYKSDAAYGINFNSLYSMYNDSFTCFTVDSICY